MPSTTNEQPATFDRHLMIERIESVLIEHVRPILLADGGEVTLVGIDDDRIVQIRLGGACQGCPSSSITMTMGVESILKSHIPEIRFVEAVV